MNNTFLNGMLPEDVFMTQPDGFVNQSMPFHMCKLHRSLYRLKQAPKAQ